MIDKILFGYAIVSIIIIVISILYILIKGFKNVKN